MKALILAGGRGKRLRPLTFAIPKPLVPVRGKPIIEHIIEQLRRYAIREIYVSTNYKSDILKLSLGAGEKWGVRIQYLDEKKRLGTAGPIRLLRGLPEREKLLVMNGDILTTLDLHKMCAFHERKKADLTVGTVQHRQRSRFGELEFDPRTQAILDIREKPIHDVTISAGIYVCTLKIRKYLPEGRHIDMPELIMKLVRAKKRVMRYAIRERWSSIEQLSDYDRLA